ncbi:MAG: prepilin-type N-terminal cleavage/methylation domain-containing protein [Candidatus Calescibacterium sp.]|nr:prepilin-type N-terminal cleavage/methylation domain-containing protein [Candidatus Calescibacterium sp.]MDW8132550.1 prepilin-type N-terminal cleavage/methylation domain-containing protein [Candidatus Calescibacterium sp.]
MKRGFTLIEVMVAMALALLLIVVILISTVTINKVSVKLYKKYEISLKSKIFLNKITKDLNKNNPPFSGKNPIISLNSNSIEFYSVRIASSNSNPEPTIVNIIVNSSNVNNGVSYVVDKKEYSLNGSVLEDRRYTFFIESQASKFEFYNLQNVVIRIYLKNQFNFRNQKHEIYYKVDVPVNIQ